MPSSEVYRKDLKIIHSKILPEPDNVYIPRREVIRQPWKPRAYTVPSLIVLFFFNNILGFLAYYFSGKNE